MKRKLGIVAMSAFVAFAARSRPLHAERAAACDAVRCESDSGCSAGCKCRINVGAEGRCAAEE